MVNTERRHQKAHNNKTENHIKKRMKKKEIYPSLFYFYDLFEHVSIDVT